MARFKPFPPLLMAGLIAGALALLPARGSAGEGFEMWPGTAYDEAVPDFEDVLDYAPGERITWHGDVVKYFEALAAARPDQVRVMEYAKSWEGRSLIYVAISSPENIARLSEISAGMKNLADPRQTNTATAEGLIADLPGVVWLSYGVHGNEISSTDAAMMTAYHLLAAKNNPRVAGILENTVVFLDPMQNPDGRDRFIHGFEMAEGLETDADRLAAEHDELWPSGRMNHYLFDLNRDWFALSQPETRGRVRVLQDWFPLAYVDAHEMGSDSTYYFAPEAVPYNPHLAKDQRDSLALFGKNHAQWFDKFGFDYFTREVFDAFFPGYGASWPSYFGSVAMTYEQASSRGLKMRRYDGKEFRYRDTVRHHFVTSISTAEVVAANREKFLRDFYEYRKSAIAEGSDGNIKSYIIPAVGDRSAADKMIGVLAMQGVEVLEATSSFRACRVQYQAGSYVISLAQPAKRLIRTLMDVDVPMEKEFVAEQERRRAKKLPDEIYDVTAWSLPAMYNVRADACGTVVTGDFVARGPEWVRPGKVSGGGASVAYMVPWGSIASTRLLAGALRLGLDVKSSDKTFTMAGRQFPSGTLILKVDENPENLEELLAGLAAKSGAEVVGTSDSWVTKGPNFGSRNVVSMVPPKVAIAWDMPTHPYSAGNSRFVIEHQIGYPVTPIRSRRLATADLSRYQVLILPQIATFFGGDYTLTLGKKGTENIKRWVENGGTLILFGNAMRYAADPNVDLIAVRREEAFQEKGAEKKEKPEPSMMHPMMTTKKKKPPTVPGKLIENEAALKKAVQPKKMPPDPVAGVLARASVDSDHWMAAGLGKELNVLVRGPDIYTPIKMDKGVNVVHFVGADELLVSGYMWQENRVQLAYKPFAIAQPSGRGFVIGFTQEPTVRAYLDGLNVILANAIFRGAAHARPIR
jgi:hypothetical protein